MDRSTVDYLTQRQCARQWQEFLRVLGAELADQLPQDALRLLFYRTGTRFAAENPIAAAESVQDMQTSMNAAWTALDWGTTTLEEVDAALVITHHCSPLVAAFGAAMQTWTPAFLEGAYQQWFTQLGSSEILRVKQTVEPDAFGTVEFRLAKH
ncbi:MAG: cellulose biosynthesis protein BcsD [Burkholderiaceae bacterium]